MKILLTGASGLLGSDIACSADKKRPQISGTVKVCSNLRPGFLAADLTTEAGIGKIDGEDWDVMIHSAAWRSPDQCEKDRAGAYLLNVWATEKLASLAAKRGAKMLYISTDYVFPGTNPPW